MQTQRSYARLVGAIVCGVLVQACASIEQANDGASRTMESTRDSDFVRGVNDTLGRWGNWINSKLGGLSPEESNDFDEAVEEQLNNDSGAASNTRRWRGRQSGTSATIRTKTVAGERSSRGVKVLREVVVPANLSDRSGVYQTSSRTNLRRGPGTKFEVIETLEAGHRVQVSAESANGWYMLEQSGTVIGFVYGKLLKPAVAAAVPYAVDEPASGQAENQSKPGGLPYAGAPSAPAGQATGGDTVKSLPYGGGEVAAEPVVDLGARPTSDSSIEVERACRQIRMTADNGGTKEYTVCRGPDGRWQRSTQ